jgi:hypothetical protein
LAEGVYGGGTLGGNGFYPVNLYAVGGGEGWGREGFGEPNSFYAGLDGDEVSDGNIQGRGGGEEAEFADGTGEGSWTTFGWQREGY